MEEKKNGRVFELDTSGRLEFPCIPEAQLTEEMEKTVEPYLAQYLEYGYRNDLYYELFFHEDPKGTIVISYGFTESCEKYHEMIYYFHRQGYQVAVQDHRGHGKSVREVENKSIVYVRHFHQYVEDLHGFVRDKVVPMKKGKSLYLYAHSMGGCIGSLYLERHPNVFERAVLNAPMLGIQLGGMPAWAARTLSKGFILFGQAKGRVFVTQEFQEEEPFSASAASSPERHAFYREIQKKNEAFQTSCCSYQWLSEALKAGKQVIRPKNMAKVTLPVLLFQALEDTFVTKREQDIFIEGISDGRKITVQSRHEIYRAPNDVLEPYLAEVYSFFEEPL